MRALACLSAVLLAATSTAWGQQVLVPSERALIERWYTCSECDANELVRIVQLHAVKPESTMAELRRGLLSGPPAGRRARVDSQLTRTYDRDTAYAHAEGVPGINTERHRYVEAYGRRFADLWRIRAALALGQIHSAPALAVLDSALAGPLPQRVQRWVHFARDSLPVTSP